jgi:hypothetical protein
MKSKNLNSYNGTTNAVYQHLFHNKLGHCKSFTIIFEYRKILKKEYFFSATTKIQESNLKLIIVS